MSDEINIEPQKENQLDPNATDQSDIQTEKLISVEKVMDLIGADFELFYAKDGWNEVETEDGKFFSQPRPALEYLCFRLFQVNLTFNEISKVMDQSQLGPEKEGKLAWQQLQKRNQRKIIISAQRKFYEYLEELLKKEGFYAVYKYRQAVLDYYWQELSPEEQRPAEKEAIIRLLKLGLSKPQIFKIMADNPIGYWQQSDPEYKKYTYQLAFVEFYEPNYSMFKGHEAEILLLYKGDRKQEIPARRAAAYNKIADLIVKNLPLVTNEATKEIYYYIDGIYQPYGELMIKKLVKFALGTSYTSYSGHEVTELVRIETVRPFWVFNMYKYLVALENGVLDTRKGIVLDFSPEFFLLEKIPVSYDPAATCPTIDQFLKDILPDVDPVTKQKYKENAKYRKTLVELAGYCLVRSIPIHQIFVLTGKGRNGKTTYLELLSQFLGHQNISSVEMADLEDTHAYEDLVGKLANLADDLPRSALSRSGKIKALTGGKKEHSINPKGKKRFNTPLYAKMIFACNEVPNIYDTSDAIYDRFNGTLIEFTQTFRKDNPKTDPNLLEKLTKPEELSGFLNLAIVALKELFENKRFASSEDFEISKQKNMIKINPLQVFRETFQRNDNMEAMVTKREMYMHYKQWCALHNLRPIGRIDLTKKLKGLFDLDDQKFKDGKHWICVELLPLEEKEPEEKELNLHESIIEVFEKANLEAESTGNDDLRLFTKEEVFTVLQERFSKGDFDIMFDKLDQGGELYSPRPGIWKRISSLDPIV